MPSDRRECRGRRREIEEPVAARIAGAFDPRQPLSQALVGGRIVGVDVDVARAGKQPIDGLLVHVPGRKSLQAFCEIAAEDIVGLLAARNPDDRKSFWQQTPGGKVVQRGQEEAMSEVSGRAENDEAAWARRGRGAR